MVIISNQLHAQICEYIRNYNGLAIDCEKDIIQQFNLIDEKTLISIVSREWQYIAKKTYWEITSNPAIFQQECKSILKETKINDKALLFAAIRRKMPPVNFCRLVLSETLKTYTKKDIAEMLKNPDLIPCKYLAINTVNCLCNDSRDGPIPDLIKQCIGIEYEVKLKEMASAQKLVFYDEADLRKTGFDKTPDLKLAIPCLYKGCELNWIESKASFGDVQSHQKYVKEQLSSYVNRFGPGLVIYWFGHVASLHENKINDSKIFITDEFPADSDLQILNISL